MSQAGPIAVYGATGYTGRLVARELARRDADFVLSGRSPGKLRALANELGQGGPIRPASLDDRDALRHVFGECAVVINCAGPFAQYGEPVVRAAVETGTHYVDTTGEQTFMRLIYERLDDAAKAAEVAVIPAVGFDYVPGDLLSAIVARGVEPLSELIIAYSARDFATTRGTLRSALGIMAAGGVEYRDGDWRPIGSRPRRAAVTFPEPIGRTAMVPYPSGETLTVPRHTRTRNVISLINADLAAPGAPADLIRLSTPLVQLVLRTPAIALANLAIDRLPEGPSEEQRRAARFDIVAIARGEDGRESRGIVHGGDVYGLTAVTAVHSALLLAEPGYDRAGALSPASAFDPIEFLDHLGDHGVTYERDGMAEEAAV